MMGGVELRLFGYKYFPYELELARREAEVILGVRPTDLHPKAMLADLARVPPAKARRLTYFESLVDGSGGRTVPLQARLEAKSATGQAASRQNTRYSAHGLHEYRGKFNPQIVRFAANYLGLGSKSKVWDPFCGSGTVLLEAAHDSRPALGTDLNPLGVLIANAKLAAIKASSGVLRRATDVFCQRLEAHDSLMVDDSAHPDKAVRRLIELLPNREYLESWFPMAVLAQLAVAMDAAAAQPIFLQEYFRVIISNVVRDVSWQEPADLRIRRRKERADNYPALRLIVEHARDQHERIALAKRHLSIEAHGRQFAVWADSAAPAVWPSVARKFLASGVDAVITSPPYATALPYIDTQRLSLALLNLASPQGLRRLEMDSIGTREVRGRAKAQLERQLTEGETGLPESVVAMCRELLNGVDPENDGFRKANVPALLVKYFGAMRRVLHVSFKHLKPGGSVILVVGPNQTTIGGALRIIDTPGLLASVAEHVGLVHEETIPLQAYHRYSLHSSNSIREERLVVMRKGRG